MEALVAARSLSRSFGHRRVVNEVDFDLGAGESLALFGPNGAGKTTLLRLIGGLLRPHGGSVSVAGDDPRVSSAARRRIGLVAHHTMLYDALTARENVELAARLYAVGDAPRAAADALASLGADAIADRRVGALSRGLQQRVALARALVHRPTLLLADEPFTAVDEAAAELVRGALRAVLERGGAVITVTHNLAEGLEVATRAMVMRDGRIVRDDATAALDAAGYAQEYRRASTRVA